MNTNTKDGGPAFPYAFEHDEPPQSGFAPGMSLRDWFAGRATAGDIEEYTPVNQGDLKQFEKDNGFPWSREWAKYRYADAMLAARSKEAGK